MLSNAGYWNNINDIGYHLIDPDLPVKPQRHAMPVEAARLERLVGSYRFEKFVIAVTRLGDRLFAQLGAQPPFEVLRPLGHRVLLSRGRCPAHLRVRRGRTANGLVLHQNNRDQRGAPL